MILSIIKHNDSTLPPLIITLVQVSAELQHKPFEHFSIVLTSVDCVIEASFTAYSCNDIGPYELSLLDHLIMLTSYLPSMTSWISTIESALIDVYDSETFV